MCVQGERGGLVLDNGMALGFCCCIGLWGMGEELYVVGLVLENGMA